MDLVLEAKNVQEMALKTYLEANASDELKMKIAISGKTLTGAWKYIMAEAKKQLNGKNGYLADEIVYGMCIHYFEEDSIKEKEQVETKGKVAVPTTSKPQKEAKKQEATKSTSKAEKPQEKAENTPKVEIKKKENSNKGYVQITLDDLFDI